MYPFRMKCYSVAPLFLASLWRPLPRMPLPLPPSASGESCCQVSLPAFRRQKRCLRVTQVGECQPPRDTQVTLQNIHLRSQHLCFKTCLVIWLTILVPATEGYAHFWKMHWFDSTRLVWALEVVSNVPPLLPKVQASMFLTLAESCSVTND